MSKTNNNFPKIEVVTNEKETTIKIWLSPDVAHFTLNVTGSVNPFAEIFYERFRDILTDYSGESKETLLSAMFQNIAQSFMDADYKLNH